MQLKLIKKRCMGRKAQLTMFFIIGILLIAAFAFMWFLNTRVAEQQMQGPTEKMIADLLKTGAIPYYVGVCLENVSKQGVVLAGLQGGDIFFDQGGPAPNPNRFLPLGSRVTYGILSPFMQNGTVYPEPPGYPGGESRLLQVPGLNFGTEGRFGEVSLRRLCDTYGPNSALAQYVFGTGGAAITHIFCQAPYIYADVLSTQWQLEQFIQKRVVNCTNWTAIYDETGYNVTPLGDPNVTFRLGINDVYIDAFIPLRLDVSGGEPIYTLGEFNARLPLRLKRIVELASFLSAYDAYSLNFNLSGVNRRQFEDLWDTNIFVKVETPLKSLGVWDDVVTIEDTASVIDGKNYVYTFARQNRYPALNWIHQVTNWTDFDYVVMENDTIVINPNSPNITLPDGNWMNVIYDPDEDNLTYYYTGWKETCNEEFDFTLGIPVTDCSSQEPTHPSLYFKFPNAGVKVNELVWLTFAMDYLTGKSPMNWTESDTYHENKRNATFVPSHSDIGPHNVTVWVCDEAGLCDYQVVSILVFDYPMLHINGTNPYSDIPYDRASVEDFYRLSAEGTTAYYTPLLGYIFSDVIEPFEYIIEHPSQILDLPVVKLGYERDIRYIHNFTFNRSTLCDGGGCDVSMEHQVNLTIPLVDLPPKFHNVTVYQCLPHRNQDNPLAPMWPYNISDVSPYEASHMCCGIGDSYNITLNVTTDIVEMIYDTGGGEGVFAKGHAAITDEYGGDFDVDVYNPETGTWLSEGSTLASVTNPVPSADFYTSSIDGGRINITFNPRIFYLMDDKEIIVRVSASSSDYPAWGEWYPASSRKVCHGGEPMYGALPYFESSYSDFGSEVGETRVTYPGIMVPPGYVAQDMPAYKKWINDIVITRFARFCSGDRGNICSGVAEQIFKQLRPCEDMDLDKGEIESCVGAPTSTIGTRQLVLREGTCEVDADCVGTSRMCFDGRCYVAPTESCFDYGSTKPQSFESVFELNRTYAPTEEANGTCNPNPTCSDDRNEYDVTVDEGRYLLKSATCDRGSCDYTMNYDGVDCWEYNGYTSELKVQRECRRPTGQTSFWSTYWNCSVTGEPGPRDGGCVKDEFNLADPDVDRTLCEACISQSAIPDHTGLGAWRGGSTFDKRCCGDDLGEGGYRYNDAGINAAYSATFGVAAGDYSASEEVCDDYVDRNGNGRFDGSDEQIDNDCRYGANCEDGECSGVDGPLGRPCCRTAGICYDRLHDTQGVSCDSNMCDCNAITGDDEDTWYTSRDYTDLETCLASNLEAPFNDRYTLVNGLSAGDYTFEILSEDALGLDEDACDDETSFRLFLNGAEVASGVRSRDITVGSGDQVVIAFYNNVPDIDCVVSVDVR